MLEISVAFLPEPFWGCYGRRRVLLERGWLGVFSVCETESVYVCMPCRAPLSSCTAQLSSAQLGREERRTRTLIRTQTEPPARGSAGFTGCREEAERAPGAVRAPGGTPPGQPQLSAR